MTTHRDPANPASHVDMGAQYVTRFSRGRETDDPGLEETKDGVFRSLLDNGILVPFHGTIEGTPPTTNEKPLAHYVSPNGLNSISHHFIAQSNATPHFNSLLTRVDISKDTISAYFNEDSHASNFDVLILTMPVPQFMSLKGNVTRHVSANILGHLGGVSYSSRYALGLFFPADKPFLPSLESDWTAKYFDHPIIRYTCWDDLKRSNDGKPHPSSSTLLVHSSVPFGLKHLEDDKQLVEEILLANVRELIPGLPAPSHTHLIRWRYSQVYKGYPGGHGYVLISESPLVILTGDAFTHSNLEGCIAAAHSTVNAIKRLI